MSDDKTELERREEIARTINAFLNSVVEAPWMPTIAADNVTLVPEGVRVSVKPLGDVRVTVEIGTQSLMQMQMVTGLLGAFSGRR